MMTKLDKSTVFVTFFLSLFCGSLVCTSLVTSHWLESKPWRKLNPLESSGHIHFGLLFGKKELNVAFGLRPYDIKVSDMIKNNPEIMSWGLWCTTLVSTSLTLIFTGLAIFLSALNSITTPQTKVVSIHGIYSLILFVFSLCLVSICSWIVQFQNKLSINVLPKEDLDNHWTSENASSMGYSFWLMALAAIIYAIIILLIKWSMVRHKKEQQKHLNIPEEKSVGAIMLY